MYRILYNTTPCKLQGILEFKGNRRNPFMSGPGRYEDTDGIAWDVNGIIWYGEMPYVQARQLSDAPAYYGTAPWNSQGGQHMWMPYLVELGDGGKNNEI